MTDRQKQRSPVHAEDIAVSGDSQKPTTRRPGRPSIDITPQERQERSRQCARVCRTRKNLRYQYLEQLVKLREKSLFRLRGEIKLQKRWCEELDKGVVPEDLKQAIAESNVDEGKNIHQNTPSKLDLPEEAKNVGGETTMKRSSELLVDSSHVMGKSKLYSLLMGQYKPSPMEQGFSHSMDVSTSGGKPLSDQTTKGSQIILVSSNSSDGETDEDIVDWILKNEDILSELKSQSFTSSSQSQSKSAISDFSSESSHMSQCNPQFSEPGSEYTSSSSSASSPWLHSLLSTAFTSSKTTSLPTCSTRSTFSTSKHSPIFPTVTTAFDSISSEFEKRFSTDQSSIGKPQRHSDLTYRYMTSDPFKIQPRLEPNIQNLHERSLHSHNVPDSEVEYVNREQFDRAQQRDFVQRSRAGEQQLTGMGSRSFCHTQGLGNEPIEPRQPTQSSNIESTGRRQTQRSINVHNPITRDISDRSASRSPLFRTEEWTKNRQRRSSGPEIREGIREHREVPNIQRSTSENPTSHEESTEYFSFLSFLQQTDETLK